MSPGSLLEPRELNGQAQCLRLLLNSVVDEGYLCSTATEAAKKYR